MQTIKQNFVPYQEALALKELGFAEPCLGGYIRFRGSGTFELAFYKYRNVDFNTTSNIYVSAPLYQQAFKFFRDKYKLIGLVQRDINRNYNGWWFKIFSQIEEKDNPITLYSENFNNDTYEEAELECLKKLIEIVKKKQL